MFVFWWVGAKFVPGGTALSAAMVNCFVHVLMYTYYAISALQIRRLLGWKRQLTLLQLLQFSAGVLLGIRAIVTNCQFTRWMQYFFVCYAFSFILLFGQFYRRTYGSNRKCDPSSIVGAPSIAATARSTPSKVTARVKVDSQVKSVKVKKAKKSVRAGLETKTKQSKSQSK
jgi:hypothetical protein